MDNITVGTNRVANRSGVCTSQSGRDNGGNSDKRREDVDEDLETRSGSGEVVTTHGGDDSYTVTWTVVMALAVTKGEEVLTPEVTEKNKRSSKESTPSGRINKAEGWYHVEYKLLPGDTETARVDLLLFGPVVKMYHDDKFKQTLRTWQDGDQTWIGWTQTFHTRVDRDLLIHLLPHRIKLTVWNSKEKLSSQARYERLKPCKIPQEQLEDAASGTFGNTKNIVNKLRTLCERKSSSPKKHQCDKPCSSNTAETAFPKPTIDASQLTDLKSIGGVGAEISPVPLFAGETSVAGRFPLCSCGVFEVMCDISLDQPLISDHLKADLNPLVITICSATSMPSTPVPFHVLQEKCADVFCQYKLHNLAVHRTKSHQHSRDVYFGDVNVMLTGLMDLEDLWQYLSGPPMEIEVHDRDRKSGQTSQVKFGYRSTDDVGFGSAGLKQKKPGVNSYGVANLDLSELLNKNRLKVNLPIKCCPPPPVPKRGQWSPCSRKTTDAEVLREPMPQGHYLDANSELKVEVVIARPLNAMIGGSDFGGYEGPYGRIIYLLHYNNFSMMTKLRSEVLRTNAAAFHLGPRSPENREKALSNFKMNFKCDRSEDLDFITGFHVLDRRTHIFVLEGLKHKAVKRLWEAVPMRLSGSEEEQVIVLYNSNLGFFKRIYDSLDLSLRPIPLCESLETIMRRPLVYVRGWVPQPCFQALSRLSQLCQARRLKDVVQCNLFPSADMILSLEEEYGLDVEQWEQKAGPNTEVDVTALPVRIKRHASLDTDNQEYIAWKQSQQSPLKDFIQDNIKKVHEDSEKLQKPKAAVLVMDQSETGPTHNYSTQSLNSKELAKELLRKQMAQVPGRRFTYSQQYHSATVEPGDPTSTSDPGCYPSPVWFSSMGSDTNWMQVDEARVEELRKPWRENILHGNILKPTLSRDVWTWSHRHDDFLLYSKPPDFFSHSPVTIHLAGHKLQEEQAEAARAQYGRWLKKLLPGNGPVPEFKCHMGGKRERLRDILKDEPRKFSLRKPGLLLKPFPQLSVMKVPYNETEEEEGGVALAPGPFTDRSLRGRNNAIGRQASLYNKYRYSTYSEQHWFLHKRRAPPLTEEEKHIFTFQECEPAVTTHTHTVQPFRNIVEVRTHKDCTLFTK